MFSKSDNRLSRYQPGSLRELLMVSLPLILSLMSGSLMFFFGRLLLASFSLDAHNAAVSAGLLVTFLEFPIICTVCIAEVFVGQANGAGEQQKLGIPVWQMIWLSLISTLIYIPIAYFGAEIPFVNSPYQALEASYFKYLLYFSPAICISTALSAFYIGQGKLALVTISVIVSNILNVILSYLLIFGCEGWWAPQGITGAAIATGISQLVQALWLFADFLSPYHRKYFGTGQFGFVWNEFVNCLRVGLPSSLAHTIEIFAWALFFRMLIEQGEEHATVAAVGQSIFFLFTFLTEGISKGATTIAANFFGSGNEKLVHKLLSSGLKLYLWLFFALGIVLVLWPAPLIHLFVTPEATVEGARLYALIAKSCYWVWLFFLFDGIHWLVVGLLTAAGDTKYVLKIGSTTIWLFALLPAYILIVQLGCTADIAWSLIALYGLAISILYLKRFQSNHWKQKVHFFTG